MKAPEELLKQAAMVDDLASNEPKKGMNPLILVVISGVLGGAVVFAAVRGLQPAPPPAVVEKKAVAPAPPVEKEPAPVVKEKEKEKEKIVTLPVEHKKEESAPPKPQPKKPARSPSAAAPSGDIAVLSLTVNPWAKVWIDGKSVGRTPLAPLKLRPGHHVIKLENPEWHVSRTDTVDLQPGSAGELTVTFTPPR